VVAVASAIALTTMATIAVVRATGVARRAGGRAGGAIEGPKGLCTIKSARTTIREAAQ